MEQQDILLMLTKTFSGETQVSLMQIGRKTHPSTHARPPATTRKSTSGNIDAVLTWSSHHRLASHKGAPGS